jgi:hypothetical protein
LGNRSTRPSWQNTFRWTENHFQLAGKEENPFYKNQLALHPLSAARSDRSIAVKEIPDKDQGFMNKADAVSGAKETARQFFREHAPTTTDDGQRLVFDENTWVYLDEDRCIRLVEATPGQVREHLDWVGWLEMLDRDYGEGTLPLFGSTCLAVQNLLAIMEEHDCWTVREALPFLPEGSSSE